MVVIILVVVVYNNNNDNNGDLMMTLLHTSAVAMLCVGVLNFGIITPMLCCNKHKNRRLTITEQTPKTNIIVRKNNRREELEEEEGKVHFKVIW